MELRQLRYFITLAEELHFGRAAAREHIVQSAMSQQLQRLERELKVRLLERNTHRVQLTSSGIVFLAEARQILANVDRAAFAAQRAAASAPVLRVGAVDASYDSMALILHDVRERYPTLEIHEREIGMPEQFTMLAEGRLDVGLGRASPAPPQISAELVRLDPLGLLVSDHHPLARGPVIRVAAMAVEPLLLAEEQRAPEFNQFVLDLCRSVGFLPTVYRGTVGSVRATIDLVRHGRCVACTPASCVPTAAGIVWRPLVEPTSRYPWSLLWRSTDDSEYVRAIVSCARRLAATRGWLDTAGESDRSSAATL